MKNTGFLVVICSFLFSCSEISNNIIENNIPAGDKLEVGIKNNTQIAFTKTEIISNNSTFTYQTIAPDAFSNFLEMPYIYSEADIRIQTDTGYFSFSPSYYQDDTKVTKGLYYFEVNIDNNQKVSITRKTF